MNSQVHASILILSWKQRQPSKVPQSLSEFILSFEIIYIYIVYYKVPWATSILYNRLT